MAKSKGAKPDPQTKTGVLYAVVEVNWEYNDSNYYRGENSGGSAIKGFRTRERAMQELKKLTADRVKSLGTSYNNVGKYGEHNDGTFDDTDKLREVCEKYGITFDPEDRWNFSIPPLPHDDNYWEVLQATGVEFFEIQEIPIEED